MRWTPTSYNIPETGTIPLVIDRFAGLNTQTTASQIADNESPDLLNITFDAEGRPDKRFGYQRVYATSLGAGKINGMFNFVKKDGTTRFLIHWGTNLYTQTGSAQPVQIYTGLANNRSVFFAFNDYVWILDGTNYVRYDGTTVATVQSIAYIPTVLVSTPPAGGGTALEDFNLIGNGFKQMFSGNGTATVYQLGLTNLSAAPPLITAIVNGTTITEGSGLTVDRVAGTVTFTTAPANGTNNVIITAYKSVPANESKILNCTDYVIFGGTQDTRVFIYGNQNFPNFAYRSGLYDPSYFPENGFIKIGSDAAAIKKMVIQYDTCIILKGPLRNSISSAQNVNDNLIWAMTFELNDGVPSFPVIPVNNQIGCIGIDSVQLINNAPTWLSDVGVHQLQGTNVRDERNTAHISGKVDRASDFNLTGLMQNTTLASSVSADFDQKYILALNDAKNTAFIFDYLLNIWYKWDNIPASCFVIIGNYLYFGSNTTGLVYKFMQADDTNNYRDDTAAINCYWKSKPLNFGSNSMLKTAPRLWYHLRPSPGNSSADLSYVTDYITSPPLVFPTEYVSMFAYSTWDYSAFTYLLTVFPVTIQAKIKAKKFMYLQIILANPRIDESMGILLVQIDGEIIKLAK